MGDLYAEMIFLAEPPAYVLERWPGATRHGNVVRFPQPRAAQSALGCYELWGDKDSGRNVSVSRYLIAAVLELDDGVRNVDYVPVRDKREITHEYLGKVRDALGDYPESEAIMGVLDRYKHAGHGFDIA